MDWTGYPKGDVTLDSVIDTPTSLAAFLGLDPVEGAAIINLIEQAAPLPAAVDGLSVPYGREVVAWRAWVSMQRTGTAGQLLEILATMPDPQDPDPGDPQLVPIVLDRMQVAIVGGISNVSLRYRPDSTQPVRTSSWTTDAVTVQLAPELLGDPAGARVAVTITAPEADE